MRKKIGIPGTTILMMLAFLLACPTVAPGSSAAAGIPASADGPALLLYDSLALSTPRERNVETLERLLAAYGIPVAAMAFDRYAEGTLKSYRRVVVMRNAPDLPPNGALASELAAYEGDYLQIGGQELPDRVRAGLDLKLASAPPDTVRLKAGNTVRRCRTSGTWTISQGLQALPSAMAR